jgi:hypothetical protein
METITITHRVINGKNVYNKRFDDYDKGFYGRAISKKEYYDSDKSRYIITWKLGSDTIKDGIYTSNIVERITYQN